MADNRITIDLEFRKEQAQNRLRQFETEAQKQLEKLQRVQARYANNPSALNARNLRASQTAYNARLDAVAAGRQEIDRLSLRIDAEEARRGGRLFGMAVNKQTEKFVKQFMGAYVGREVMNLGFAMAMTPYSDNRGVEKAQAASEGAMSGAMMGSAFGPYGAAAGLIAGGALGYLGKQIEILKREQGESFMRQRMIKYSEQDFGQNLSNSAFEMENQYLGRENRLKRNIARHFNLTEGWGEMAIPTLQGKLERLAKTSGVDTEDYRRTKQLLEGQISYSNQLAIQTLNEYMRAAQPLIMAGDYTGNYEKQGLYGAGVTRSELDFAKANEPIVEQLRGIRELLKEFAKPGDKSGVGSRQLMEMLANKLDSTLIKRRGEAGGFGGATFMSAI